MYETKEEAGQEDAVEESEIDEEEDRVKEAERRIRKEEVWREMFLTSYGRDKAFVSPVFIYHYSMTERKAIENYSIFYSRISIIPRAHCCEQTLEKIEGVRVRSRTCETVGGYGLRSLTDKVNIVESRRCIAHQQS